MLIFNSFIFRFDIIGNIKEGEQQIQLHRQWCELASIEATPTIYINGKQMPLAYKLDDVETLCAILIKESTPT